MTATIRLRCELCGDTLPTTPDAAPTVAAADHLIDEHRLVWLGDGVEAALANVHVVT